MRESSLYTTGEFAKRANISVRTIRYYDSKGLLKPSVVSDSNYRYYTDSDFAKLQRILVLRSLGFSLEDIAVLSADDKASESVKESFALQLKLIREKISELKQIEQTLQEASSLISEQEETHWSRMVSLIYLLNMEETLAEQYKNSKNIEARINLHKSFSVNSQGWYHWIYSHLPIREGGRILEVGCGNGQLWKDNLSLLPQDINITLSDISSGMLKNAGAQLKESGDRIALERFDLQDIPYAEDSFDLVIANHVLFYAKDREKALSEVRRVLRDSGIFCCSAYGRQHMKEIELLAKEFDERIALSDVKLYDIFGLDNGAEELSRYFEHVEFIRYEDALLVTELRPLADYIYSCHGNQMEFLIGRQEQFERFLLQKMGRKGLHITKDVGIFLCRK
jgi:DNA-binding transcriptional MerR regulator